MIYGAGLQWSPSDRTQVTGFWEHRFFGSSYSAQINHRLPRIALGRELLPRPQQLSAERPDDSGGCQCDDVRRRRVRDADYRSRGARACRPAVRGAGRVAADTRNAGEHLCGERPVADDRAGFGGVDRSAQLTGLQRLLYQERSDLRHGLGAASGPPVRPEQHADGGRGLVQPPAFGNDQLHGELPPIRRQGPTSPPAGSRTSARTMAI